MRFFAILLLCLPLHVLAHGNIHDRIVQLDAQIASDPGNAELHLRRGRTHIEEEHFDQARADFEKALELNPELYAARYFLGETLLLSGKPELAEQHALQFLQAQGPEKKGALSRGYWLLGEARFARHSPIEAIAAYRDALKATAEPTPDHYRTYVDACLAAEGPYLDEALQVLDQALASGGSIDQLQSMAVEVELKAEHTDAALQRLAVWIAQGTRLPFLHYRKAEILADAGRMAEASNALASARSALNAVPETRRKKKAYVKLEGQIAVLNQRIAGHGSVVH